MRASKKAPPSRRFISAGDGIICKSYILLRNRQEAAGIKKTLKIISDLRVLSHYNDNTCQYCRATGTILPILLNAAAKPVYRITSLYCIRLFILFKYDSTTLNYVLCKTRREYSVNQYNYIISQECQTEANSAKVFRLFHYNDIISQEPQQPAFTAKNCQL